MLLLKYIGLLFSRAAQKSVLLTDRMTILIVPFATLVVWLAGAKMTDSVQETLALGVAMTVLAVVFLRLVAASYFVWKDDRATIAQLETEIASPRFVEANAMNDHRIALRKELGDRLAWLITFAEARAKIENFAVIYTDETERFAENFVRAREIISQLSYDAVLRVTCLNLLTLATSIAEHGMGAVEEDGTSPKLDRLWQQRKLTFKLLHRQDLDEVFTMAEIENLLEEHGEGFGDTALGGIRAMLKENPSLVYNKPRSRCHPRHDPCRRGFKLGCASRRLADVAHQPLGCLLG